MLYILRLLNRKTFGDLVSENRKTFGDRSPWQRESKKRISVRRSAKARGLLIMKLIILKNINDWMQKKLPRYTIFN